MDATAARILELGAVLLAAAGAGWLARRASLPAVVGYLVVGLLISPFTPGVVADRAQLQLFADVGVVLLLFEVGIEVDVERLRKEQRNLLCAAPAQVILSTGLASIVAMTAGLSAFGAALLGVRTAGRPSADYEPAGSPGPPPTASRSMDARARSDLK
jgi:monovalent cation:H+ antiporter-2, CPA2 family